MSRFCLAASAAAFWLVVGLAEGQPEEPFPPKGDYTNSVHRFFPDLDAKLNTVRYGRWRALEIAWVSGIDARGDSELSSYYLRLVSDPPRFDPEAFRVAPRFAREASVLFKALHWGQVFEAQVLDILSSPDSSPALASERMARLLAIYHREPFAIRSPPSEPPPSPAVAAAPLSARLLVAGTRLFTFAAEDLAASDFGQQRWRVKKTLDDYDFTPSELPPLETAAYRVSAPTVQSRFPKIAAQLDAIAQMRRELFDALVPGPEAALSRQDRNSRARDLAQRWGLPAEGIGER
jgi:hypothetical protein